MSEIIKLEEEYKNWLATVGTRFKQSQIKAAAKVNMDETVSEIQKRLFELRDEEYRAFQCRLMPTVPPDTVIGVRTPALRKFARGLAKNKEETAEFLISLPHQYYEENNLHGFLLETINDFDSCIEAVEKFFPYIDNWATCDMVSPGILKKNLTGLLPKIREWMASGDTYAVRFAIRMLMNFYLDGAFRPEYLDEAAGVRSGEYYVRMMVAWYFATALAKQYESAVIFMEKRRLEPWTHNKAIQKALESRRVPEDRKEYLRTLKYKGNSGSGHGAHVGYPTV